MLLILPALKKYLFEIIAVIAAILVEKKEERKNDLSSFHCE